MSDNTIRRQSVVQRHPLIQRELYIDNKSVSAAVRDSLKSLLKVICLLIFFCFTTSVILFFITNSIYVPPKATESELCSQLRELENYLTTFQQNLSAEKKQYLLDDVIQIKSLAPMFEQTAGNLFEKYQYLKSTLSNFGVKFEQFLEKNPELKKESGVITGKKDYIFSMAMCLENRRTK
ncbi:hypothetical protein CDIK_0192 [Cucumispora dikerogammari]|nr:hypothetical protein CDIK_0192 [Cucumispora dikerogammari]